ncbi:hypothetical protein LTR66_015962 [Elasticomyces elasticus]|nr:hypothetical protein LTR66_015962 [Elasticomyces elasticus]
MGSVGLTDTYSVPKESKTILESGIFNNPKLGPLLPPGTSSFANKVKFTGNSLPSLPINWRFAESSAALKGLEACVVANLVKKKYGVDISGATINTDHASLFSMSTLVWSVPGFKKDSPLELPKELRSLIPDYGFHNMASSIYRASATNIHETKDGKYFHIHSSLNPNPTLEALGLPTEDPNDSKTWEDAMSTIKAAVKSKNADELQILMSDQYKQAGQICETVESFRASEHGKANEHVALFECHDVPVEGQGPSWWPDSAQTSAERPLAGLKVVDLTRIIAAPAVTRGLAELGASVMRVTSPNICDYSALHVDLSWGKWSCSLDLKTEEGRQKLKGLILEADVVLQGYRPGVLDKYGFGQQGIIDLCKDRRRGIVSARENCYGWNGPWVYRSGWQQISDACCGVSERFGRAMGLKNGEAVTPVFPNSDYCTGLAGVIGIITALMRRAEKGGSYKVDLSLNYYSQWLTESVGEYPEEVWQDVWQRNGRKVWRSHHNMTQTLGPFVQMIKKNSGDVVFNPDFFETRETKALGININTIKPIVKFDNDEVRLAYNVGTRGNGKDQPRWPQDLMVEVVS